jgi:hypothetical protein
MDRGFTIAVLLVSGLGALGLALLVAGVRDGEPVLAAPGAVVAAVALFGVVALARAVAIRERVRRRR